MCIIQWFLFIFYLMFIVYMVCIVLHRTTLGPRALDGMMH